MTEHVYLSWGGTGRSACLRLALERARDDDVGLLYLAVLDDPTFSDLDRPMLRMVEVELTWVLEAQIEMARGQIGAPELPVRVLVCQGELLATTAGVVETLGSARVLVGAPVPVAGHESVGQLLDALADTTGRPVELIDPGELGPD